MVGVSVQQQFREGRTGVNVTTIRVVAGILAVVVLFIIIWRRKKKAAE
jgi:LPXTG-motif cell wall-anchored protein